MKYGALLIDVPWPFRTYSKERQIPARAAQPYEAMAMHEIAGLPVPDLLAKSGAVFLWDCDSIPGALELLTGAWGLKLATRNAFIWDKGSIGMGYWARKQCEVCHMLKRGTPRRKAKDVRQLIQAPRREHSRKPDEIYSRIERLVDGPYLEMFARQRWPGWDQWGDEINKFEIAV